MKFLRVWLLVVLAVLLPVRGAVAAAMLCPPPGAGSQSELPVVDHAAHGHEAAGQADHPHDHVGDGHHGHDASTEHDKCNLCSAFCSNLPVPSAIGGVPEPLDLCTASFPDLAVPAPTFLSDGQERPPRSI